MRVISGTHRGRPLLGPRGSHVTRPMTDRVKQSLFDRLWSMGALNCSVALDVFAGTGSLGIEALSRGVEHCTFVENDHDARQILTKNLNRLSLAPRATVLGVDALSAGWTPLIGKDRVELAFCDPPYGTTSDPSSMTRVSRLVTALAQVSAPGAVLILRTHRHTQPDPLAGWAGPTAHRYGSTLLHFFELAVTTPSGS